MVVVDTSVGSWEGVAAAPASTAARRMAVVMLGAVVLAGYAGTIACGRADNGDFMKIAAGYAAKPRGFSAAWPPPSSPETQRRFFAAWLPQWEARADGRVQFADSKRSSGHVLWLPGALIARAVGGDTLDLRWVGLPARLASAVLALATIVGLTRGRPRAVLAAALFTGVATDAGYLSFLNTWFEEGPCLPYALALFAGLAVWARGRSRLGFVVVVAAAVLLTTCRSVNAAFGVTLVVAALAVPRRLFVAIEPRARAVGAALLVLASVASATIVGRYPGDPLVNPFNALFYGALTFVADPAAHLARLGFEPDAARFVGRPIFVGDAREFAYGHAPSIRFANVLAVYAREPAALGRAAWFAIGRLHDTRLAYLPMHATDVAPGWPELGLRQRLLMPLHGHPLAGAAWLTALVVLSAVLARAEPDGAWAGAALALFACAIAGTMTAILGDGRQEIEKHLWTVNLMLDLGMCAAVAGWCERRAR